MSTATENNLVLENAKKLWELNSKKIIIGGTVVILLCTAWIVFNQYKQGQNEKANESIFLAENLFGKMASTAFNKDSINIVLNGGDFEGSKVTGLLKVIKEYGSTPTGDRAKYMAGTCYLNLNKFDDAIKYLKDFDGNDALQLKNRAYLMMGHAYAEKKNVSEALNYYQKAAKVNLKDETLSCDAYMIYARFAEANGKNKEAVEAYKLMKDEFATYLKTTNQIAEVEKHLARLGELN